jgi:hypothetical protein
MGTSKVIYKVRSEEPLQKFHYPTMERLWKASRISQHTSDLYQSKIWW